MHLPHALGFNRYVRTDRRAPTPSSDHRDRFGHLEFLPSGDAALTRRARKASRLSAVVVCWNTRRSPKQTLRADRDARFRDEFAAAIREQFPGCPVDRAEAIALHAAARGSGRVGRSAAGRALNRDAVRLARVL